jgi:hypothetical protein
LEHTLKPLQERHDAVGMVGNWEETNQFLRAMAEVQALMDVAWW